MNHRKVYVSLLTSLAVLVLAGPLMAFSLFSHSPRRNKTLHVDVIYRTSLGKGINLSPGNYKIVVPLAANDPMVAFYRHGRKVAQVTGLKVADSIKNPATAVTYSRKGSTHLLTRIDLGGMRQSVKFPSAKMGG